MNIFKKTIFSVLLSLLLVGNVYADKIRIGTERCLSSMELKK